MGHLEIITKYCYCCKQNKPADEFYATKNKYRQKKDCCKTCSIANSKKWYSKNKNKVYKRNRTRYHDNREKYIEFLSTHPCVDCGEEDIVVLQADHQRDKKYELSRMMQGYSWDCILEELRKCHIVCANCHMRRTAKTQGWFKNVS